MSTVELLISPKHIHEVHRVLKESGAKFYPFKKLSFTDYKVEIEDHPIVSFIVLKYVDSK